MSSPKSVDLDLLRPEFDQTTYFGRVRHFLNVIDPSTLLTSDAELAEAKSVLARYERGETEGITREQFLHAKKIKEAIIHPDTGEKIFAPFRWSAFVPTNIPLVIGMLFSKTSYGLAFWQFANQSYNVSVNYANRNASNSMSMQQIGTAYAGAVLSSCGLSLGLNRVVNNMTSKGMIASVARWTVPFIAAASAGSINVLLMRWNESVDGVEVKDEYGNQYGRSRVAGKQALLETAITRVVLPAPILLFPPMIMTALDRSVLPKNMPNLRNVVQVGVIASCLWLALPAAIGLFKQERDIEVSKLEPEFQNLKDKHGNPISRLYFNKGS